MTLRGQSVPVDHDDTVAPRRASIGGELSIAVRIAAATSVDRDGRTRYRGQARRGQPPRAFTDAKDIVFAIAELERAHAKFVAAQAMEHGSRGRKRTERDGADHVRLAAGFVDEILDRRRM